MGSAAMPIPGASNPTGAFDGTFNPNYSAETFKAQQNIYQTANPGAGPLGIKGPNVFSVPTTTPGFNPNAAPPPVSAPWTPGAPVTGNFNNIPTTPGFNGSGGTGLMFGYPTGPTPTFNMPGVAANGVKSALGLPIPGGGAMKKQWGSAGAAINQFMVDGMGFNPQIAGMLASDMDPYFQANMNNLMEMFGSAGGRYSSDAALAGGQATAQFSAQQQQIFAEMYQQAIQNYLHVLTGGQKDTGGGGGIFGSISSMLGLAKAGGAGASAGLAASAGGAGVGASILAGLAAL